MHGVHDNLFPSSLSLGTGKFGATVKGDRPFEPRLQHFATVWEAANAHVAPPEPKKYLQVNPQCQHVFLHTDKAHFPVTSLTGGKLHSAPHSRLRPIFASDNQASSSEARKRRDQGRGGQRKATHARSGGTCSPSQQTKLTELSRNLSCTSGLCGGAGATRAPATAADIDDSPEPVSKRHRLQSCTGAQAQASGAQEEHGKDDAQRDSSSDGVRQVYSSKRCCHFQLIWHLQQPTWLAADYSLESRMRLLTSGRQQGDRTPLKHTNMPAGSSRYASVCHSMLMCCYVTSEDSALQ